MIVLILGGTKFLGRHLVQALRDRGHEVVLFNRGRTNPELFPELRRVHGDREKDSLDFGDLRFDAVIDTSGYLPGVVRASASALREIAQRYVFVSSVSVYDPGVERPGESSAVARLPEGIDAATFELEHYGPLKALCEAAAAQAFGAERTLVVRPGLIVGPHDPTDRFSYWPFRVARGGEVLAPDDPGFRVQFIDVRDLAEWMTRVVEQGATGIYNATSLPDRTLGEVLECCREVSRSDARFEWVAEGFLEESKVSGWIELPLWVPQSVNQENLLRINVEKARAAGLRTRLLRDTVAATLDWLQTREPNHEWKAGLSPSRERELLEDWHRSL